MKAEKREHLSWLRRRGKESVEADWELRGFQPVGQKIQFKAGETDAGFAVEGKLVRRGPGDVGHAIVQFGRNRFEPGHSGSIKRQLGLAQNQTKEFRHKQPLLDPFRSQFPVMIDQVAPAQIFLQRFLGKRIDARIGQSTAVNETLVVNGDGT